MLSLPDMEFTMNDELLDQCYTLWEMSGFHVLPNPYEVMNLPHNYVFEMKRWHQGVHFFIDFPKRPSSMK